LPVLSGTVIRWDGIKVTQFGKYFKTPLTLHHKQQWLTFVLTSVIPGVFCFVYNGARLRSNP